jgi:hypothetical protein
MDDRSQHSLSQEQKLQREYEVLQTELQEALTAGVIMQGSAVLQRYKRKTKSGIKECGPYHLWTRKVQGKTVTVSITREQYRKIRGAIAVRRKIDELLKKMQQISQQIILKSH